MLFFLFRKDLFLTLLPQNHNILIIQKLVPTRSVRVFDTRKLDQKELIFNPLASKIGCEILCQSI